MQSIDDNTLDNNMFSIVNLLGSIASSNDKGMSFLESINDTISEFAEITKGSIAGVFSFFGKNKSSKEKQTLNEQINTNTILSSISDWIKKIFFLGLNKNQKSTINSKSDITIKFFDKPFSSSELKSFDLVFSNLLKFVTTKIEKLDHLEKFMINFGNNLKLIGKASVPAATGILLFATSIGLLTLIPLIGIPKLIITLVGVGFAIGFFIKTITKAISGTGFFKSLYILHQLPDLFKAIGESVLLMSIGLLLFEFSGYGAILKLITVLLSFGLALRIFKDGEGGTFGGSLLLISMGIAITIIANQLINLQKVKWETVLKLNVFIVGLGLALKLGGFSTMLGSKNVLSLIGVGLALIVFSLMNTKNVDWDDIVKMNIFVVSLGVSLRAFGTTGPSIMTMFAISLVFLSVALMDFSEIDIMAIVQIIGIIGLLGFVINKILARSSNLLSSSNFMDVGTDNFSGTPMFTFAFGLVFLVGAMLLMQYVPFSAMLKTIVFIIGLGIALKMFSRSRIGGLPGTKGPLPSLFGFSMGLVIMVLAMDAMSELPWSSMIKTLTFILILGIVTKFFGKKTSGLFMFSLGLAVMILAIDAMSELPWQSMFKTILFIGLLGLAMRMFPKTGTLMMFAISVALLVMVYTFKKISSFDVDMERLVNFGLAILGAVLIFNIIGNAKNLLSVTLAAVVLSLAAMSLYFIKEAFVGISEANIDLFKIGVFVITVTAMVFAFSLLTPILIPATVSAVLLIVFSLAVLLASESLQSINKVTLDSKKIDAFSISLEKIINAVNNLSGWDLAKSTIKAVFLIPIMLSMLISAKSLNYISSITIDKTKIAGFTSVLGTFIDSIVELLINNEDKLKQAGPGILALTKIMNLTSSIARVIGMMANMNFYEYGVTNGKLVLKGVRKLKPADFKLVGANIATMLETLIEPLLILGSNSSTITIGGKTLTNPFKSRTAMQGIDTLAKIGNAFKPLAESIKDFASNSIMTDPKLLSNFTYSIQRITNVFSKVFVALSKSTFDFDNVEDFFKGISDFSKVYGELPKEIKNITDLDNVFVKFLNSLSDDAKWKKIHKNLTELRKEFASISKSINSIDIEKATLFERNLKLLIQGNNTTIMKDVLESSKELINGKETTIINNTTTSQPAIVQRVEKINNTNNEVNVKILEALNIIISKFNIPELPSVYKVMVMNDK